LVCGGSSRLAPDPPCSSVLPPGAGNEEPEKAVKTDEKRAKEAEDRSVLETGVVQRHLDTPTVCRDDDGDVAAVPTVEQTQLGLPNAARRSRAVPAVYGALCDRATTPAGAAAIRPAPPDGAGNRETAGVPAVSQFPPSIPLMEGLPPALSRLENESGTGQSGNGEKDSEGLRLQHASHLVSSSADRRRW